MSNQYQYLALKEGLHQHIETQTCFHQSLINKTMLFSKVQFIIYLGVFNLNFIANVVTSANCRQAEYEVGGECCPTCSPGTHVKKHCTEFTSTSCAPCSEGNFQDSSNGLEHCFSCQRCDSGLGLKLKKSCTLTSDALCEPLDGYFCTGSNRGGCMAAQRHTVCSPGQYISQKGTADRDTVCLQCPDGTFSNGTSTSCPNHRICSSDGLDEMQPGTNSTDSTCVKRHLGATAVIIIAVIIVIFIIIGMAYGGYRWKMKRTMSGSGSGATLKESKDVSPSDQRECDTMIQSPPRDVRLQLHPQATPGNAQRCSRDHAAPTRDPQGQTTSTSASPIMPAFTGEDGGVT